MKITSTLSLFLSVILLTGCFKTDTSSLNLKSNSSSIQVKGTTVGYGTLREDGRADFGLVLRSFQKQDLFQIELDDLMSTSTDRISVFGYNLDLPSNVALPDQRERYFLSIRLNKPQYRVDFKPEQDTSMIILHGQFPFSDVIDGFRNGTSLLQLAGLFNILSYSEYQGQTYSAPQVLTQDLTVGQNPLRETQSLTAPNSIPRDYNFVAVSLLQSHQGDSFFPTDIKVIPQGRSAQVKVERGREALFTGLFHSSFADSEAKGLQRYKMSLQLQTLGRTGSSLLGFVEDLKYTGGQMTYLAPSMMAGMNALGVSAQVFEAQTGQLVHSLHQLGPWTGHLDMTALESFRQSGKKYRIEVSLHASTSNDIPYDSESLFNSTELVTKNAIEI